ncbi:hypothetical protein ASPZODRAFT_2060327 [Penicilliopsis zonata CBS 506.65]|uniref:Uncharacterized protein n=1 Tax=Penicilliopsis zonata CBS 506.65 TaxID=1073090 RepID=A0A1L9SG13_9EURO|nr:hypothetical protein ASPZODRAFT_2060327 [Penicilliopsis zonata CBS 506.65]OJJ46129.1 hypothetical protein ASPZODRAFT_2060327 [Penicilliopsis zonata CBS 506.65]
MPDKGKTPEKQPSDKGSKEHSSHEDNESSSSLADRIQSSAARLARDAFYSSSSSSSSSVPDLASILSSKTEGSSGSRPRPEISGPSHSREHPNPHSTRFRSTETAIGEVENGFIEEFENSPIILEQGEQKDYLPGQKAHLPQWKGNDGEEVLSLLSSQEYHSVHDYEPMEDLQPPPPLSEMEMQIIQSFRLSEGGAQTSLQDLSSISSISLIPGIDSIDPDPTDSQDLSLRDRVLDNLPGAQDWIGVQEGYHDAVWGYLRPVLENAAAELTDRPHNNDTPAVKRVQSILGYMRAKL